MPKRNPKHGPEKRSGPKKKPRGSRYDFHGPPGSRGRRSLPPEDEGEKFQMGKIAIPGFGKLPILSLRSARPVLVLSCGYALVFTDSETAERRFDELLAAYPDPIEPYHPIRLIAARAVPIMDLVCADEALLEAVEFARKVEQGTNTPEDLERLASLVREVPRLAANTTEPGSLKKAQTFEAPEYVNKSGRKRASAKLIAQSKFLDPGRKIEEDESGPFLKALMKSFDPRRKR